MFASFTTIWTELLTWFVSLFSSLQTIFVTSTGDSYQLTFVGVCAIVMAGVALILLAFNLIRSFISMRG